MKEPVWKLDWNLLRTYMVIVQEGSITSAANRLSQTQPSISNALKRLEERLERKLIQRRPGRFELTKPGRLLFEESVEIFGTISRLTVLMRDVQEELSGHVRISMASHITSPIVDKALADFHASHPKVTFNIQVLTSRNVQRSVLQKDASFGLSLSMESNSRLNYTHLYREHFGFFCGPEHHLFGIEGVDISQLSNEPLVSFQSDQLSDALRSVALMRITEDMRGPVVGTSANLEEVKRMIINGLGIGPLPVHVVSRDIRDGLLWRLPPYDSRLIVDVDLVTNPRTHLSRAESGLIEQLIKATSNLSLTERTYG
ncbi:LysR family transcriptional regulator [uncultured Cocleimonas sp.]|uniref:LysR family transcriptional regulator n=1 Tax=uncultured Cocleimonas sp. TaxID=1051587 RepID=UPI00262B83A8|nr:LysR family transcriptional regulator [uncultured Cocleimonas sp.]